MHSSPGINEMEPSSSIQVFSDHSDPTAPNERLSVSAVVAFIFGIASSAALIDPLLWIFAGLGLLGAGVVRMRLQGTAASGTSRGLATAGLLLAVLFASWAPTAYYLRRYRANQQAIAVGNIWVQYLLANQPDRAFGMAQPAVGRPVLNDLYESFVNKDPQLKRRYDQFRKRELVEALIALGRRGRVQCYKTKEHIHTDGVDQFIHLYAVTYVDDDGQTKTFFVELRLRRTDTDFDTNGLWQVVASRGNVLP